MSYYWECTFCENEVEKASVKEVKSKGKIHLNQHHRSGLSDIFQEKWAGNDCQSGCDDWFPANGDFSGFRCPHCGHDHFDYFAGQHVWVGIKKSDD